MSRCWVRVLPVGGFRARDGRAAEGPRQGQGHRRLASGAYTAERSRHPGRRIYTGLLSERRL